MSEKTERKRPPKALRLLMWVLISPFRVIGWVFRLIGRLLRGRSVGKFILTATMSLLVLGFVGVVIIIAWFSRGLPDEDNLFDREVAQSTKVFDRTGEHLLYEFYDDQNRTQVSLDDIPQLLIDGVIATEDTAFYEHKGIRPLSMARAVFMGVFTDRRISGASTLTQQLVKNAILTNERSFERKIKEAILTIKIERTYTKEQILWLYLNEIPFGSTNYGVEAASQNYFGSSVSDLSLEQIATLAGLPKAPSTYLRSPERLKNRRDTVLERMYLEGYITREEADAAQASSTTLEKQVGDINAPHFVFHVREQLEELLGEKDIDTGGYTILTTLDWDKQQFAEKAVEEQSEKNFEDANANNTSLVSLDPNSGQILAMVGSRDYFDKDIDGSFNVATQGRRQPGSSFKPIVYAAAFEKGYTPQTVLFDVITDFSVTSRSYKPLNYDLSEHGLVTMQKALQGSLNIPAVKTLYLVGEQAGIDFAKRLGYSTFDTGDFGLSLVLGGGEVSMLEHANAFAVFANEGERHEPVSLLRVESSDGDVIHEWKASRGEQVLEKEVAQTLTSVLSNDEARAYAFGTGGVLTLPGRPVAAKTGTTNGYIDAWTVGYTPELVTAVWAGNTDNTPMTRGFGGSRVAGPIWKQYMTDALEDTPVSSFTPPPPDEVEKAVLRGSQSGGITLRVDKVTGKLATTGTPERYIVERTYVPPHSILHYVDKNNPRGDAPEDPTNDTQYEIWEASIQDWIVRKQEEDPDWEISFEEPPTEYDDIHTLELIPEVTVVYPLPSSTLFSRDIATDIRVSAPRGVTKVSYFIDGRVVGIVREHPFNLVTYDKELTAGDHVMTILVEDDVGNTVDVIVPFRLDAAEEPPAITWVDQGGNINSFPYTLIVTPFKPENIQSLTLFATNGSTRVPIDTITSFEDLFNDQLYIRWGQSPGAGQWVLESEIITTEGAIITGDSTPVTIQ